MFCLNTWRDEIVEGSVASTAGEGSLDGRAGISLAGGVAGTIERAGFVSW